MSVVRALMITSVCVCAHFFIHFVIYVTIFVYAISLCVCVFFFGKFFFCTLFIIFIWMGRWFSGGWEREGESIASERKLYNLVIILCEHWNCRPFRCWQCDLCSIMKTVCKKNYIYAYKINVSHQIKSTKITIYFPCIWAVDVWVCACCTSLLFWFGFSLMWCVQSLM